MSVNGNFFSGFASIKTETDHFSFYRLHPDYIRSTIFKATGPIVITLIKSTGSGTIAEDTITPIFRLTELF